MNIFVMISDPPCCSFDFYLKQRQAFLKRQIAYYREKYPEEASSEVMVALENRLRDLPRELGA